MRKLLISILIALLLLVTAYSIWKGISIGNIKILSFTNIKSESENLDTQIAEITKLKEQDYKKTLSDIESNAKLLLQEKEKYATLVSTSTDTEIEKATQAQKYEQDFLWAKIGNHATAQGVTLKFDIAVGAVNKENYDLYFTVNGTYTNITEFVMALENDNLLGFKIENFKLIPENGGQKNNSNNKNNNTTNTTNTDSDAQEENENNQDNTNSNTTNDKNNKKTGNLEATFKVTDISINIDKTKLTNNDENDSSSGQASRNTTKVNTNTNNITNNTNTVTEGTVEED